MPDPNLAPPTDSPVHRSLHASAVSDLGNILDEVVPHPLHDPLLLVRRAIAPMTRLPTIIEDLLHHD